ncbi:hypothetical protein BBI09_04685 [Stutzerimonas xanthomarina]|uniref:general secretion pathway protein GspB n=1 Tax=Stutzerimonas nitrititolerans TaxID=2482751 RepID=UPI000826FF72|nr:general secretion pathway protein GspB [Stutzerimonas nitrititolerans]OCX21671.1 hypothetical protein BBI09_04685 [Stutzerimonas xanthomarina]HBB78319.1 hypothetical protein [Pseudomonas sp.]HCL74655.1 hypothetical protein [Pseudomonas sp.]
MKRKYLAAGLLVGAAVSCALAYQLASAQERQMQQWRPSQDTQLQGLDARLGEKVQEFLELNELLSRQLETGQLTRDGQRDLPLLTGPEAAPKPRSENAKSLARPSRPAPWWSRYKLSMVVASNGSRSAVINGRYVRMGDALAPGVVVRRIAPGQVTLVRAGETARLTMGAGR